MQNWMRLNAYTLLNFSNVIWNWTKQVVLAFQNTLKETPVVCICYLMCIFVHFNANICTWNNYTRIYTKYILYFPPFFLGVPRSKTNSFNKLISSIKGYLEIFIWLWFLFSILLWIFIFHFCLYNLSSRSGEVALGTSNQIPFQISYNYQVVVHVF